MMSLTKRVAAAMSVVIDLRPLRVLRWFQTEMVAMVARRRMRGVEAGREMVETKDVKAVCPWFRFVRPTSSEPKSDASRVLDAFACASGVSSTCSHAHCVIAYVTSVKLLIASESSFPERWRGGEYPRRSYDAAET